MASPRHSGSLESVGSQRWDRFVNLKRRRDRDMAHTHSQGEPSFHFERIGQHEASNYSGDEELHNLEKKVEHLCRCWRRRTWRREGRTPSLDQYLGTRSDGSYRPRSRTPPSKLITSSSRNTSWRNHYHKKSRTPLKRGQGHDAMGKALLQISRSSFSQRIEQAELPCCFNQLVFIIYNGKADPVEHMSYFNQRWPFTQRIKP